MEYITDCLRSSIINIIVCVVLFISVFIGYKMKKVGKKEITIILLFIFIFMIPRAFFDFKFYYEYYNNPKIEDVIEIESIENKTQRPLSSYRALYSRYRYTNIQFLYSMDSRKFILKNKFNVDEFINKQEEELLDIIEIMREDGVLSDLADNYIEEQEDKVKRGDKYKITYVKTGRYNVIVNMEHVQK